MASNENYSVSYDFEGTTETVMLISDINGDIQITGLASGAYTNIVITEIISSCSDTVDSTELIVPSLSVNISFNNPTLCGLSDWVIIISDLLSNESYLVSYDFEGATVTVMLISDIDGDIQIIGLASGEYTNILIIEIISSCSDTVNAIELIPPSLSAAVSFENPTNCILNGGIIIISGWLSNENYIISYDFEDDTQTAALISDFNGVIQITDLSSGIYSNIIVNQLQQAVLVQ